MGRVDAILMLSAPVTLAMDAATSLLDELNAKKKAYRPESDTAATLQASIGALNESVVLMKKFSQALMA